MTQATYRLSTPPDRLANLRTAALDTRRYVIDFPSAGQQTIDSTAFAGSPASAPANQLTYPGIALCGPIGC